MNTSYVGIHALLVSLPLWATVLILYTITDCVMHLGRDRLEGLGYQVAYSAKFGDVALFGAVFIAVTILQRGEVALSGWMMAEDFQLATFFGCMALGFAVSFFTLKSRSGQWMDFYHDAVIAPMVLFFAIMLLPVIYLGGTVIEKFWTVSFIVFWVILVGVDIKLDRMNQRGWIKRNLGIALKGVDTSS
jgi:hypothetical protein